MIIKDVTILHSIYITINYIWFYWCSRSSSLLMFTMVLLVFTNKFTIDVHYGSSSSQNKIHYLCSLVLLVFKIKFTMDVHYGSIGVHNQVYYRSSLWFYWCSQSSLVLMFTMVLLMFTVKFTMVLLVFAVNVLYICTPF